MITAYVQNIRRGATTIFEGMAVTFSHLLRAPITTQYPDRTPRPMMDLLPERFRGHLWVDLDICIGCILCEKFCPIDCIKIDEVKIDKILVESRLDGKPTPKVKDPIRFDINMYKCMYCGLCVEPCPTGAIFFTKEFEGASQDLTDMHLRLVDDQRREQVLAASAEAERKAHAAKAAKAKKPPPAAPGSDDGKPTIDKPAVAQTSAAQPDIAQTAAAQPPASGPVDSSTAEATGDA